MKHNHIKTINITKEQFEKSKYFTRKYGELKYISESGNMFKTSKGNVLRLVKEGVDEQLDEASRGGIAKDNEYVFLRVSVSWDLGDIGDDIDQDEYLKEMGLPSSVFIKVPREVYNSDEELNLSEGIEDCFSQPVDDIYPMEANERDRRRVKDWLFWTKDGLLDGDEYELGMQFDENTRIELVPTNGRKSFGNKAYVEDDGDSFTLFSYNTPVAKIYRSDDGNGQDFYLIDDYISNTTLTHIHSFLQTYGLKDIPTKEILELDVGKAMHLTDAESRKRLANEAGKKVIPAANGCSIHDMGDCWIVTNKNGLNIGQCRTLIEAEDIAENADEYTAKKLGYAESRKLVKEGAGAGYTVSIKGLELGRILDKKYVKMKKEYESYYECQVEIVPGEYEIAAEDYYNDFFWQEHEFGETPTAKIDGGVATIVYSTNSYDEDEADDELRRELENRKLNVSFDYGWGWVHANLPPKFEADHVDVAGEFYGGIEKLELNAPDLADAVNAGHQSIYDRDEGDEEPINESFGDEDGWRVFDYGEDFPYTERYTVLDYDGYQFFISHNGGVGAFQEDAIDEIDSDKISDILEIEIEGKAYRPRELDSNEISSNRIVQKGLKLIKAKFQYENENDAGVAED